MGGRGSSSMSGGAGSRGGGIIGDAEPIKLQNRRSRSSDYRAKELILEATVNGTEVDVEFSKAVSYEHPNKNTTIENHLLKAGFYNEYGNRDIRAHSIDLTKATVVRGRTYDLRDILKESGFRWDSEKKEWRR